MSKNPETAWIKWAVVVMIPSLYFVWVVGIPAVSMLLQPGSREQQVVLAGIRAAELGYYREFGHFVSAEPWPPGAPSSTKKIEWMTGNSGFDEVGFLPKPVYCLYGVSVSSSGDAFTAESICDRDGNGNFSAWGYVYPSEGEKEGIKGPFGYCSPSGAYNIATGEQDLLEDVGPCRNSDIEEK